MRMHLVVAFEPGRKLTQDGLRVRAVMDIHVIIHVIAL